MKIQPGITFFLVRS